MTIHPFGFLRLIAGAAVMAAVLSSQRVAADSDGYYCVGQGFVAYDVGFVKDHTLRVVRVGHSQGITQLPPIALDDFQVHGMTCTGSIVILQGWTQRYSVSVSGDSKPTVVAEPVPLNQATQMPSQNLGMLARSGVVDIPSDGLQNEFQLVVAQTTRRLDRSIEHYTITQVIRRDATDHDRVAAAVTLFTGIKREVGDY